MGKHKVILPYKRWNSVPFVFHAFVKFISHHVFHSLVGNLNDEWTLSRDWLCE